MQYPKDYIVFDIETTGFSGTKNKCIEIGALKVVDGQIISTFEALLNWNLKEEDYIPDINGITHQEVEEKGIDPEKAFQEFLHFITWSDFPIFGHNVIKFDIPFLIGNFPRFADVKNDVLDTAVLYKASKIGMEMRDQELFKDFANRVLGSKQYYGVKYSVDACCEDFKIDKSKVTRHRALGDCELTNEIYKNLCKNQKETGDSKRKLTTFVK